MLFSKGLLVCALVLSLCACKTSNTSAQKSSFKDISTPIVEVPGSELPTGGEDALTMKIKCPANFDQIWVNSSPKSTYMTFKENRGFKNLKIKNAGGKVIVLGKNDTTSHFREYRLDGLSSPKDWSADATTISGKNLKLVKFAAGGKVEDTFPLDTVRITVHAQSPEAGASKDPLTKWGAFVWEFTQGKDKITGNFICDYTQIVWFPQNEPTEPAIPEDGVEIR